MEANTETVLDDEQLQRREIGIRARKRDLESREFRLQTLVSGAYAGSVFMLGVSCISFVVIGGRAYIAAGVCACLAAAFAYALRVVWRRGKPSPWLVAAPCIALLTLSVLFVGIGGYLFWFNVIAAVALFFLARTWRQLAALPNYSLKRTAADELR